MISVDKYLDRKYNSSKYNCAHLVSEVWKELTGSDISTNLSGYLKGPGQRKAIKSDRKSFTRIESPKSPCIVLMQSPRNPPHVGIFLRDRILHISDKDGVRFDVLSIATIGYKKVGFFVC